MFKKLLVPALAFAVSGFGFQATASEFDALKRGPAHQPEAGVEHGGHHQDDEVPQPLHERRSRSRVESPGRAARREKSALRVFSSCVISSWQAA